MIVKMAREKLGLSQPQYAALFGRNASLIFKREKGGSKITREALAIAQAILKLLAAKLDREDVIEALESVSRSRRSEGGALVALSLLALRRRLPSIVQDILAMESPPSVGEDEESDQPEERPMKGARDLVEDLRKALRVEILDASDKEQTYIERAVEGLGTASEALWMVDAIREKSKGAQAHPQPPDEDEDTTP